MGGGQGELVGTRNNNPDFLKKGFFSWEGEGREKNFFLPFYIFSRGGGWRIEINCTCGPPYFSHNMLVRNLFLAAYHEGKVGLNS